MNRRRLLRIGLGASAASLLAPSIARAHAPGANPLQAPFAGGLYYTSAKPGRWKGKEDAHAPTIERTGDMIEITTGHEMKGFEHYIIKHAVFDRDFGLVGEKMFDPRDDAPVSQHDIRNLSGVVYAMSVCNIHDAWIEALVL